MATEIHPHCPDENGRCVWGHPGCPKSTWAGRRQMKAAQASRKSRRTVVDDEGNVACGNCGAKNNFATRRTFFESKKVRCMGCGKLLRMR